MILLFHQNVLCILETQHCVRKESKIKWRERERAETCSFLLFECVWERRACEIDCDIKDNRFQIKCHNVEQTLDSADPVVFLENSNQNSNADNNDKSENGFEQFDRTGWQLQKALHDRGRGQHREREDDLPATVFEACWSSRGCRRAGQQMAKSSR